MSIPNFDAENAQNSEDIEKQFAVKAVMQAETYWGLLTKIPGTKLKLTKYDDEIVETLLDHFPEFKIIDAVKVINEEEMKSSEGKARWRKYLKLFEGRVEDYNFGTLIRVSSEGEYDQEGTIFVLRLQFYGIELLRNRYGLNDWISEKYKK